MRIAIIGAGPSGILTAKNLIRYTNQPLKIKIFGKISDSQCRTVDVDGIKCDVGTCYLHSGYYNTVVPLAEEYGFRLYQPPTAQLYQNDKISTIKNPSLMELFAFFILSCMSIIANLLRFTFLSKLIFSTNMKTFLNSYMLNYLNSSLTIMTSVCAQGYGFLEDVSAYHLFNWLRPTLFLTPLFSLFGYGTRMVEGGYGNLFHNIYELLNVEKDERKVLKVCKISSGIALTLDDNEDEYFDQLFVCCPIHSFENPSGVRKEHIEKTRVFSFLCESKSSLEILDHRAYNFEALSKHKRDSILTWRRHGKTQSGNTIFWAFGYVDLRTTDDDLLVKLTKQAANLNISCVKVHYFCTLDYNFRFSCNAISKGVHIDVENKQGQNGIWYLGGLLSHWDIDNIAEDSLQRTTDFLVKTQKYNLKCWILKFKQKIMWLCRI